MLIARGFDKKSFVLEARSPPEPDVRCRFDNGNIEFLEVVEVIDPATYPAFDFTAKVKTEFWRAFELMSEEEQRVHVGRSYLMKFRVDVSARVADRRAPGILHELRDVAIGRHEAFDQGSALARNLERLEVRATGVPVPLFEIESCVHIGPSFERTIEAKRRKVYSAECSVDLLAYCSVHNAAIFETGPRARLDARLKAAQHCVPFRRIWIFDAPKRKRPRGAILALYPVEESESLAAREGWTPFVREL